MYKNFLITGGCGFIGSNFINYMISNYSEIRIINVDKLDYCSNEDYIEKELIKNDNYIFIKGNICDKDFMYYIMKEYEIEIIVHFAAQSHVDNSFGNSIQFTLDNILGTHTLLECCKEYNKNYKLEKFIHISTDEVYGEVDLDHKGCCEKSLLNPTNPYAATKAGAEFLVRSYYHSYKLPIIITRGNNVFGKYQHEEKLIPSFIHKLLTNKLCLIHGEGKTRRNFIYVDDVSRAIETIIMKGNINEIYNIGSTDEYSVLDILHILKEKLGIKKDDKEISKFIEDRPFNDFRYSVKTEKLENLGWKKEISFKDGIDITLEWYKNKINN
jgi:dTDP-glucose 4,6-dehydratase